MLPLRQRAAFTARQASLRPVLPVARISRVFASTDSHGHDHGDHHHHDSHGSHGGHDSHAPVDEPIGSGLFIGLSAIPFAWLVYTLSRPGKDGEPTVLHKYLDSFSYLTEQWETRNSVRTAAIEQAAHDKNLLYNAPRNYHIELRFPEVFQTGSPYNVPAGHSVNLDKVVAHYKDQHIKEVERQAKAAAKE